MTIEQRTETDTMGDVRIPADKLWGAQTQRAFENIHISNLKFPPCFIHALGLLKWASAHANAELGILDRSQASWIIQAASEVFKGEWDDHFPLGIFQTGSATSTNMNANEVISNRAIQLAGGVVGSKIPVHPNDHVNMSQSSNDIIPSTIHVAAALEIRNKLMPSLLKFSDGSCHRRHCCRNGDQPPARISTNCPSLLE
jgi:fumarate hydratase, class II